MVSLQKLLGKEDKFFDLLEAGAVQAHQSAQALVKFSQSPDQAKSLEEFAESRRKEKAINTELSEMLATSFVTNFEREDIEALSTALYKIPKTVEKIGERILLMPQYLRDVNLSRQVAMLEKATHIIVVMLQDLRTSAPPEKIKHHNAELQRIEGEADKLVLDLLRHLYSMHSEPGRIVFLKDLYELLERVTDRCRDAGNIILQIVWRSS
jgi:uncharacterized protein